MNNKSMDLINETQYHVQEMSIASKILNNYSNTRPREIIQ